MSGWLRIVGLGPGPAEWLTPEGTDILHAATDIYGYTPYINAVTKTVTATRHASDNGEELQRAAEALRQAAGGARVAVVSGGDAGIFGMAAAVFEALEKGDVSWQEIDIAVVPGMTAFIAAAARIGAPFGHDFCVISLSDYLKPWPIIEKRLLAASEGDFVLAIYNPASKTRREQLKSALKILQKNRAPDTIAILAKSIGRAEENIITTTLAALNPDDVDMRTLVIIGSSHTRRIGRFVYTPRSYE